MLASTVSQGWSRASWATRPRRLARRASAAAPPSTRTRPALGSTRPASRRSSVVLPMPLRPVTATTSPASTRRESSARTGPVAYPALTPSISAAVVMTRWYGPKTAAYPEWTVIVDPDQGISRRSTRHPPLMGLVLFALAIGLGTIVARPAADPSDAARARERLAAALVVPTAQPTPTITVRAAPLAMPAPLVIRPRQPPPAARAPPPGVASAVPADAGEAARATALTVRDASRQLVYRLQDGRTFVLLQSHPG